MKPRIEFWSSTEGAAFQKALIRELRAAGCPAEEKFAVSQRAYWSARSRRQRVGLRARTYGWYAWQVWRRFARSEPGLVGVISSNTFYAPWLAIRPVQPRRIIHWVLDLFPDVLVAGGWSGAGGVREQWLRKVMRRTFDGAAANVFLGKNLLRHAEQKFGAIPRARVIEIGADGAPFRGAEPVSRPGGPLRVLYCGNLGRMHEIDTLGAGLPALAEWPCRFEFAGNGSGYDALRRRLIPSRHVCFGPNLAGADWVPVMQAADVAVVTLKDAAGGLVMPSKTYSALVAGQAVLAVCPRSSDLAELVLKHDAGWVIAPGDAAGLVALVKRLTDDPGEVLAKRRNAWKAGHTHYEQDVIGRHWLDLIETVAVSSTEISSATVGRRPAPAISKAMAPP